MITARIKQICTVTLLGALLLSGCRNPLGAAPLVPLVPPPDAATASQIATAANSMGFAILDGLVDQSNEPNQIISPISLATVLTMLLHGADGETKAAIADVLHLDHPDDPIAGEGFAGLLQSLTGKGAGVELSVANSLWPRTGYPVRPEFVALMQKSLGATVQEVAMGDPKTVATIDEWVSDHTHGLIEEMAEDLGLPDPSLVLILLNAVYFKGDWTEPFDPALTHQGSFNRPDGTQVAVPMMSRRGAYATARGDGFHVLRLPYGKDRRFGMELFLPDEGRSLDDLRSLDATTWAAATAQLQSRDLVLLLPRFELAYHATELDEVLHKLGMGIAYSSAADFTPLSAANPYLSTVQHKTYIKVDEKGTEAAAVTGAAMDESAPPAFWVDRPFRFTISDTKTGAILFVGQVTDPTVKD